MANKRNENDDIFVVLGKTLQSDGEFNGHVRTKLVCLDVLRTLRKEHCSGSGRDRSPFLYLLCYLILSMCFQAIGHRSPILPLYKIFLTDAINAVSFHFQFL